MTQLEGDLQNVQEALPALFILSVEHQLSTSGSHFSKAYIHLLIREVQSALAAAGLHSAAKQATHLLHTCKVGADAQSLQQLMQEMVRSSQVCPSCFSVQMRHAVCVP